MSGVDIAGLVEMLRDERHCNDWYLRHEAADALDEALAALKASEEREAGLREALEPMAAVASDIPDYWDDTHQCVTACGHFRRAHSALENSKAPLADATPESPERLLSLRQAGAEAVAWRIRPIGDQVWHLTDDPRPRLGYEMQALVPLLPSASREGD